MTRRLGLLAVLWTGASGCYTFTCNDACESRIECLGEEIHPQDCAEQCVQATDTETPEQRDRRLLCWDCIDMNACEAEAAGACAEVCS